MSVQNLHLRDGICTDHFTEIFHSKLVAVSSNFEVGQGA